MGWKSTRRLPKTLACNGELVRFFRAQRGWTQQQLAEVAGYTERLVRKAESGRNVNADTIEDLAEALSSVNLMVHPEDLISHPRDIIYRLMEGFATHERQMAHFAAPVLADSVEFLIPGDANEIPFAGMHRGVDGLDQYAEIFFSMFERTRKEIFLNGSIVAVGKRVAVFSEDFVRIHKQAPELHTPVCYAAELDRGQIVYLESFYNVEATFDFIRDQESAGSIL